MIGGILFLSCLFVCLSVCLSVVNFNIHYNFWTVRGRDFIFGMHTPLMMPFQMTPRSMTLWPWLTFALKIAFLDFVAVGGIVSVSQTHLDIFDILLYYYTCMCTTFLFGCWSSVSIRRIIYKFLNGCPFDFMAFVVSRKVVKT